MLPKLVRIECRAMLIERRQRMRLHLRVFMLWLAVPNAAANAPRVLHAVVH